MIIFEKIRWRNLLSTGNYFTEIDLLNNSNTLVVGENGSGKSTMLDALCFVLFGKGFRNINKTSLVNSINGKDCLVEIEFSLSNKKYKVVRGIKPNIFEIYQDNKLINQEAAVKDYQEYLEKFILKMNYKSFTQIVILGSASFVPFMQLSAADRRSIIEDLLDIQIFSVMNSLVKERLSSNKEELLERKHHVEMLTQKYEIQKKHLDEMKKNNIEEIEKKQKEIENNISTISKLTEENEELTKNVDDLQDKVISKNETEERVRKLNRLESQIETNLSKFKKDISFFEENDDCPTCRQSIEKSFKDQEIESLKLKIEESNEGLKKLEEKLAESQSKLTKISQIQKDIQSIQIKIATNNTTINEINKYVLKLQKSIDELQNSKTLSDKEQTDLSSIEKDLKKLNYEIKELLEEKKYFDAASVLLKDNGIKTKIIKQYLPIINKLVNKYLATLDFFVNFTLDDSFKETIKSRHRDDFSYNNFSEGEKSKINLALLFTWRAIAKLKNSSNTNLLILDEIVDSALDQTSIENFFNLISTLENTNVFVISPKGDIHSDKFENVIRFQKDKNFSRIKGT